MITVPTTASRFALLHIDTDSDSDTSDQGKTPTKGGRDAPGKPRQGRAGATGGKATQGNDKKKDKKKKKREQQQSEANEVSDSWEEDLMSIDSHRLCFSIVSIHLNCDKEGGGKCYCRKEPNPDIFVQIINGPSICLHSTFNIFSVVYMLNNSL